MAEENPRISSGAPGLDDVLRGGMIPNRAYMVRGGPGSGKTILGLHFLTYAASRGEPCLLITFGESEGELRRNGNALGFDLPSVRFLDLSPTSSHFAEDDTYDIFPPSEVERSPVTRRIRDEVMASRPKRIFVDGMSQLRHLTSSAFQFRKEALAFLRFLCETGATVLFTSESNEGPDDDLQFIADGVLQLDFSSGHRRVCVTKFRGSDFRSGWHTVRLSNRGMQVFPRLMPDDHCAPYEPSQIPFDVPELDELLHGGLERGTITIVTGPSGVGKTTIGMQFVSAAAKRGEHAVVYLFEESRETLIRRCGGVGLPVEEMVNSGYLVIEHIEPLRYSADEFALRVRQQVEGKQAHIVMIDSVSGYRLAVRDEDLVTHLHALAKYLQNMGVAVLLMNEVEAVTGDFRITDVGVSYVADNIIFLRYLEISGSMSKALGVLKKRLSDFEKTLREVTITSAGIHVGEKLTGLRGILSGAPEWTDGHR